MLYRANCSAYDYSHIRTTLASWFPAYECDVSICNAHKLVSKVTPAVFCVGCKIGLWLLFSWYGKPPMSFWLVHNLLPSEGQGEKSIKTPHFSFYFICSKHSITDKWRPLNHMVRQLCFMQQQLCKKSNMMAQITESSILLEITANSKCPQMFFVCYPDI